MKKLAIGILLVLLVLTIFFAKEESAEAEKIQQGIADQIIRFHVIANSDREEDQQLKLEIKESVLSYMKEILYEADNVSESRKLLLEHREQMKKIAENIVRQKGEDYEIKVFLEDRYFPIKTYGSYTFPPGIYEALCIEIGESQGKNWWCVMYPSLCFVDVVHGVVPEETDRELKNILTEEEYEEISQGQEKVRIKFKFLEWLENLLDY